MSRTANIKIIFFDIGSVLLRKTADPFEQAAHILGTTKQELWDAGGKVLFAEGSPLIPPPQARTIKQELEFAYKLLKADVAELALDVTDEQLEAAAKCLVYRTYKAEPGAYQLIKSLGQRYRLGLLTNAGPSRRLDLDNHQLSELFDPIVISGEVGLEKPDVAIFKHALELAKVLGGDAAFVDDQVGFLDGAKEAGIGLTILYDPSIEKESGGHQRITHLQDLEMIL